MAQSVKPLALDFGSGYDLTICGFKPHIRLFTDRVESAWDSLSVPPPLMLSLSLSLSLKINKLKKQKQHEIAELLRIRTEVPCASESRYILKNKNSVYFRSL